MHAKDLNQPTQHIMEVASLHDVTNVYWNITNI